VRFFGHTLLARVYLYGLSMLALAAGASFVIGSYWLKPAIEVPARPSTTWIAWHLAEIADDPALLARELADIKRRTRLEFTLFSADGRRIASNAAAPPPPLSPGEVDQLLTEPWQFAEGAGVVAAISDGQLRHYVRVRYPVTDPGGVALAQLLAALLVLALLSMLLARSVTAPVEQLSKLTRAIGAGDLSVRARSERRDEIGDLARAFDEMASRIVGLRRSEKELLANVSHELRTPLARIRLALELARDGDITRASEYLTDIEEDLAELEVLLDDVMTAARLELSRGGGADAAPPLRRQPVEATALLEAARIRFARRFPERELLFDVESPLPTVLADPALLRRVLDNLLENAAKFSDPHQPIQLRGFASSATTLVMEVQDRGIGIDAQDLERVFEPFFRSDRSRTRATGGVGLGLAVVRRIVHAHGGTVTVTSEPAVGTRFRVEVPAASAEPAEQALATSAAYIA